MAAQLQFRDVTLAAGPRRRTQRRAELRRPLAVPPQAQHPCRGPRRRGARPAGAYVIAGLVGQARRTPGPPPGWSATAGRSPSWWTGWRPSTRRPSCSRCASSRHHRPAPDPRHRLPDGAGRRGRPGRKRPRGLRLPAARGRGAGAEGDRRAWTACAPPSSRATCPPTTSTRRTRGGRRPDRRPRPGPSAPSPPPDRQPAGLAAARRHRPRLLRDQRVRRADR